MRPILWAERPFALLCSGAPGAGGVRATRSVHRPPAARANRHVTRAEPMATISQLKQKARELERNEQWKPALDAYEQLTRETPAGEDLEVGLWNRIGDLHMRLAQPTQAVAAYERAVSAYAAAGLHNNAIALCNKILRAAPDTPSVLLTLAEISALKGFVSDARQSVARLVALARPRGELNEELDRLERSAAEQPAESATLRQVVAEVLLTEGRPESALSLFRAARGILTGAGEEAQARLVQARIEELTARAHQHAANDVAPPPDAPLRRAEHGHAAMPLLGLAYPAAAPAAAAPAATAAGIDVDHLPLLGLVTPSGDANGAGEAATAADPAFGMIGLEPTAWQAPVPAAGAPVGDSAAMEPLPLLGLVGTGLH
jgi:tetratricopeptide (TPR) repeat protein